MSKVTELIIIKGRVKAPNLMFNSHIIHFRYLISVNQSWIFIVRTDAQAETPILWPPDAKNWLLGKDPDAGKDWRQEEKGMTEDEMVASLTGWTWVWASSGSWWWTGKPGMVQSMGSQRVGHDWVTELNWISVCLFPIL